MKRLRRFTETTTTREEVLTTKTLKEIKEEEDIEPTTTTTITRINSKRESISKMKFHQEISSKKSSNSQSQWGLSGMHQTSSRRISIRRVSKQSKKQSKTRMLVKISNLSLT